MNMTYISNTVQETSVTADHHDDIILPSSSTNIGDIVRESEGIPSTPTLDLIADFKKRIDNLENDLKRITSERDNYHRQLESLNQKYNDCQIRTQDLCIVVFQLQEIAKETALERASLRRRLETSEAIFQTLTKKYKLARQDNRRMKRELDQSQKDFEGKKMKIQGLQSENDCLKRQLKRHEKLKQHHHDNYYDKDGLELDSPSESSDNEVIITGIREMFSSKYNMNIDMFSCNRRIGADNGLSGACYTHDEKINTDDFENLAQEIGVYTSFSELQHANTNTSQHDNSSKQPTATTSISTISGVNLKPKSLDKKIIFMSLARRHMRDFPEQDKGDEYRKNLRSRFLGTS